MKNNVYEKVTPIYRVGYFLVRALRWTTNYRIVKEFNSREELDAAYNKFKNSILFKYNGVEEPVIADYEIIEETVPMRRKKKKLTEDDMDLMDLSM